MVSQHFSKEDRLCSSLRIETLFSEGERLYEFPFKAIWQEDDTLQSTIKVAISVPKKRLSKASQRNHIKRLVREAYRKQKYLLVEKLLQENKSINLMLVYTLPSILSFNEIEDKISVTLQRLADEV
ncbi:MAG: ribonuclease P protein component [Flavobacteriales bacterium]|nr:ribonuclease P protein component [Flavobacteriales bacterium]